MPYIGTSPSQGVRRVHTYTATANQTTFTGAGAEGATLSYKDSNFVDVYQNGVKLGDADYTATSGTSIVLGTGATVSDLVVIVAYDVFSAADTVSKADGGQFDSSISFATNANIDASSSEVAMGTFTVDGPIGLIKTNTELRFRDDAIKIQSSADGQLDIDADTEIEITTTTVDLNGALTISGDTTLEDGADLITASAGTSNFRAGVNAGNSIASGGNYNVVVGDEAGTALTTGDNNVAVGFEALKTEDANGQNVAIGYQASKLLNAGADAESVMVGALAGAAMTTGLYNVGIGRAALTAETQGDKSVAVGNGALGTQNGVDGDVFNTAVGHAAGGNITTGEQNVFIGAHAGDACTDDDHNTFVGYNAGGLVNGGFRNTFIGKSAGDAMTTGDKNIIIGTYNGNESDLGDIRTLSNYIVLSDGDGNSRVWVTGGSNVNQFFATGIYLWTTSASANVVVTGSSGHIARSTSALKYKQDIRDLEDIDIDKFRPIRYKSASAIDDQTIDHFGFIADEVHDAGITELVSYGDDDKVEGFQYERMTAVLVKTLQEQKKTIKALTDRITALESK